MVKECESEASSAVSAGWSLGSNGPASGTQSGKSSGMNSAEPSSPSIGPELPAMKTSGTLEALTLLPLTSSAAASPAKMCPAQERARALLAHAAASGLSTLVLLENSGRSGSLLRMSQVGPPGGSTQSWEVWESSDMLVFRSLCRRKTLERRTGELESSLWPTATVADKGRSGYGESSRADRAAGIPTTRSMGTTLTDAAVRGHGHPAPAPRGGWNGKTQADLNPRFVALMMGFPADWLDTTGSEDFLHSETPLFRSVRK
jgi:hypothetical protein